MKNYLKRFWDTQADYFKEYYPEEEQTPVWKVLLQVAGVILALYIVFSYLDHSA